MWENEVIKKQIKIDPIDKLELRATPTKPPVDAMSKEYLEKIIKLTAEMMKSKDTNRKKAILQEIEGIRDKITKLKGVDVG
jgi:ribonuclease D